jgi:hypothetical protein
MAAPRVLPVPRRPTVVQDVEPTLAPDPPVITIVGFWLAVIGSCAGFWYGIAWLVRRWT